MFGLRRQFGQTKMFADQFEPDGEGFLYRRNLRAAPIRVTSSERDEFISKFERNQRRLSWAFVAGIMLAIGVFVAIVPSYGENRDDPLTYLITGVAIAGFLLVYRMIWNVPARALQRRAVVGNERPRAEASRAMLAEMSWRQLITLIVGGALVWWAYAPDQQSWWVWRLLWTGGGVALLGGMAWRAWQKWQMGPGGR